MNGNGWGGGMADGVDAVAMFAVCCEEVEFDLLELSLQKLIFVA
jgi:hypothetical protein